MGYYAIGYKTTLEYDAMAICHDMLKLFLLWFKAWKRQRDYSVQVASRQQQLHRLPAELTWVTRVCLDACCRYRRATFCSEENEWTLFVGFDIYRMLMNDPLWKRMKRSCPSFRRTLPASLEDSAIATPQQPRTKSTYVCHGYAKQSTTPYMSWQEAWQYIISESNRK